MSYETTYTHEGKINKCPFCKAENPKLHILGYGPVTTQRRWIQCNYCHCQGPITCNTEDAIKFWNFSSSEKEECETEIKRLKDILYFYEIDPNHNIDDL